jgi:hypothetical protein
MLCCVALSLLLLQRTRTQFPNLVYRVTAHDHSPCPRNKGIFRAAPSTLPTTHTSFESSTASSFTSEAASAVLYGSSSNSTIDSSASAAASAAVAVAAATTATTTTAQMAAPASSSSGASDQQLFMQQATVPQAQGRKKSARFGGECLPAHQGEVCRKYTAIVDQLAGILLPPSTYTAEHAVLQDAPSAVTLDPQQ